ncbi:MAG: undecaprenyl/decaprenyl-phosphate alpha-N-acetylglucosaminyl 1-phosphate transferase [Candidatus Kerfeldbacteria bacterium]|nr:undecaprenyl/decaprenyl-phosphate alpha-N-acetylglucosaminyl 1-phosphate transferase [Candidatus Kerfeldbacteria bacterium]
MWWYSTIFIGAAVLAAGLTVVVMYLATQAGIVDQSSTAPQRKRQRQAKPLLGGLAMYGAITALTVYLWPYITTGYLLPKHLLGVLVAGGVVMIGGVCDDIWQLSPKQQIIFPLLACFIIIASGIGIDYITNPLGGILNVQQWEIVLVEWRGLPYHLTWWADLFTLLWLMGTMYSTKMLDGLDGLVPGIGVIGGLIIFLLSISTTVAQPETGLLALLFAGAAAGFLVWNFSPAKIYLGEGGSLLCGLMLGTLAILSGSKIATAVLILGLPIIDMVWVIVRRLLIEKRSPFSGDTLHLHFQLQALGLSDRTIAVIFYAITAVFGVSSLVVAGPQKMAILVVLILLSVSLITWLYIRVQREQSSSS